MPNLKTINVVAAIIRDATGRIFATQRGYGEWKGWWEFPGGKIEPGELPQDALKREIREELATEIEVGDLLTTVEYDYPKFHLTMHCYLCSFKLRDESLELRDESLEPRDENEGRYRLLEHEAARWLTTDQLHSVKWLPADEGIIPLIGKEIV